MTTERVQIGNATNVHFSSLTCEWATPQGIFDSLNSEFHFTLDPCATVENAKCPKFYTHGQDGLSQDWDGEIVFMNPPYGRQIVQWIQKAFESNALVVCLLPSRTDTRWWHEYCMKAREIRFIQGRLRFGGATENAPFPSCVVIFDREATQGKLFTGETT